jgi:hypothetical protein
MRGGIFGALFVAAVEGLVGASDESFAPFDERSGKKTCDHANDYFLQKGRVHVAFWSRRDAIILPETPLVGTHDPQAKKKICDRVNDHA